VVCPNCVSILSHRTYIMYHISRFAHLGLAVIRHINTYLLHHIRSYVRIGYIPYNTYTSIIHIPL
jgi:hypothetical protein